MSKTAYFYVFDTMADWEAAFLLPELHSGRYFRKEAQKYAVKTVGLSKDPVLTMGGVRVWPDLSLEDCSLEKAGVLILPGGNTWLEAIHTPILKKTEEFLNAGILVAAICGATIALAQAGYLNNRYHTSNSLDYLKLTCANYSGELYYQPGPAVADGNLITASGIAPLEFSFEVLKKLDVFTPVKLDAWYKLYNTQDAKYYYALMEAAD
ncbi:MAG: type 1 glutamine amidotransferase family protein [Syntrophomonas sp.]